MALVTVAELERAPEGAPSRDGGVRASARRRASAEQEALNWLLKFIQAGPDELAGLFSGSDYGWFILLGQPYLKPPALPKIKRFHAQFVKGIRAVLAAEGRMGWRIPLPRRPPTCWYLFLLTNPHRPQSYLDGSWELGFLSRVDRLLARFGARVKLCRGCSRVFATEHGLQAYCSLQCGARQRQGRHTTKMIAAIRGLQKPEFKTAPAIARKFEISIGQARKYLSLARKDDGTQTQRG